MLSSLEIALVLLAASVIAVVALRALNLPPLVAYLAVGALLGPHATNMAGEPEAVRHAGELGVVFLMFTLGLEFNLGKLTAMRALVFGLGAAQVAVTMVLVVAVFVVLPAAGVLWLLGGAIDWRAALVLGARSRCRPPPWSRSCWPRSASSTPSMAGACSACCCSRTSR